MTDKDSIAAVKIQLQRKDDTIRNLETQFNIMRMLNVGPTTGSLDQQALETEVTQLKDALTSLRIQNDGYKIENANVNRRRAVDYYRNLYVDIGQFVVHSTKSVHVKTHQAKCAVNTSKNAWNDTRRRCETCTSMEATGKRFNLCDIYGPRMSTESIVTPSKFTPCVSPRTNVTLSMEPVLKPLELTQRQKEYCCWISIAERLTDHLLTSSRQIADILSGSLRSCFNSSLIFVYFTSPNTLWED
ncbi:hypothetical protein Tco_0365242 [Tanacetum coccineum]